mmetsp:Transcript_10683/g.32103  ORF Transcript_10683/g.32103 Transcript_10683/m.32103 type:complete len:276 (-) Transcript_10683:621-1448(-)
MRGITASQMEAVDDGAGVEGVLGGVGRRQRIVEHAHHAAPINRGQQGAEGVEAERCCGAALCLDAQHLLIEARRCDCTRSQCGAARASRRHGRGNAHIDGFACLDPLFPLLHSCGPGGSIRGVVPVLVVLIVQAGLRLQQWSREVLAAEGVHLGGGQRGRPVVIAHVLVALLRRQQRRGAGRGGHCHVQALALQRRLHLRGASPACCSEGGGGRLMGESALHGGGGVPRLLQRLQDVAHRGAMPVPEDEGCTLRQLLLRGRLHGAGGGTTAQGVH